MSKKTSYILISALILSGCSLSKHFRVGFATPKGQFYLDVISNNNIVYDVYLDETKIGQTPIKSHYFREYTTNIVIKAVNAQTNETRIEKQLSEIDWEIIQGDMETIETDPISKEKRPKNPEERNLVYKGVVHIYD